MILTSVEIIGGCLLSFKQQITIYLSNQNTVNSKHIALFYYLYIWKQVKQFIW
jgi:hypothetical protein